MRLQALSNDDPSLDSANHQRRLQAIDEAAHNVPGHDPVIAQVAHELRNPLSGVIGMTSLLMMSNLDERQRRHVQLTQSSAQMMLRLCSDLLDLARLDAGQFSLHPERLDLAELLRLTVSTFEPVAAAKRLTLVAVLPEPSSLEVVTDPTRVQQVVMNLLSNAIKYSRAGRVELRARWLAASGDRDRRVRVEVQDNGPGLPADARERLFQEYSQIEARRGGTGLGLALCRRLIYRLGGRIDVDCPPGQGCVFWFELPETVAREALAAS